MTPKTEIAHITTPVAKYTLDFNTGVIKAKPIITRGDSIRAMTDEELAEWFGKIQYDTAYYCAGEDKQKYPYPDGWLDWLKQEAEGASDG